MNLAFLLPIGLLALAALALPLLIHLARRSEQRPTMFAALRWLRARPRPRHRLRMDEWALLAIRLLLLALFALLFARPVLDGVDMRAPVVAVAPGVDIARALAAPPASARRVWLAEGFPAVDADAAAPAARAPLTSLLRELDASLLPGVALTVLVPAELAGVDGERPRLGRDVDWRVLPATAAPLSPAASAAPAPRLVIRHADDHAAPARYLRAADIAWRSADARYTTDSAPLDRPLPRDARHVAWLATGPIPDNVRAWVDRGGTLLLDARAQWVVDSTWVPLWRDAEGGVLVEGVSHGRGRVLRFTRELEPRAMPVLLDGGFPTRLHRLLETPPPAPARVRAVDHAPLSDGPVFMPAPRDLQPWLLLLIALLFVAERWMATGRRGRVAP